MPHEESINSRTVLLNNECAMLICITKRSLVCYSMYYYVKDK
jgi:hypothetical protein